MKEKIFTTCHDNLMKHLQDRENKKTYGEFCGVFQLLCDLGLEEEYYQWKEENGL